MAEKKKAIHTGHRGRVKEEFRTRGIEGWPDHRVLELLLFYSIPQGDVNPLAHELIDRFGSLDGVLDALPEDLKKVPGLGEHSVTLLKLIPALFGRYVDERTAPGHIVDSAEEAGKVLAPYFYGSRNEMVYLLCLDSKCRLRTVRKLSEGSLNSSDVSVRRAAEECMAVQASYCYLAHNHVSGIALPSPEDLITTDVVQAALAPLGVQVLDHLVFVDGDMVSIRESEKNGGRRGFRMIPPGQW